MIYVCHLCGQILDPEDRCNSGIHQGPNDLNGFRGRPVLLEESDFYNPTELYTDDGYQVKMFLK
jgi:hypothetical protein